MKKNRCMVWILVALCLTFNVALAAIPSEPTDAYQIYVNDFANLISAEDAKLMQEAGVALEGACGAQVVAVTVAGLDGMAIDEYAYELFNAWGIGGTQNNNGVLLLLALTERECYIGVGGGLENKLSSGKTDALIDETAFPAFSEGDFSTGMRDCYIALCNAVGQIYNVGTTQNGGASGSNANVGGAQPNSGSNDSGTSFFGWIGGMIGSMAIFGLILAVIVIIVVASVIGSIFRRPYHGGYHRPWYGWGGFFRPRPPRHHHHGMGPRPPMGGSGPRPPMGGGTRSPSSGSRGGGNSSGFGGSSRGGGGSMNRGSGSRGSFGGSSRGGGGSFGRGSGKKF